MSSSLKVNQLTSAKKAAKQTGRRKDGPKPTTEDELIKKDVITLDDVRGLESITKGSFISHLLLCSLINLDQ